MRFLTGQFRDSAAIPVAYVNGLLKSVTILHPNYNVPEDRARDIQTFFNSLSDMSIEESFTKIGIQKIHDAFIAFLDAQDCKNSLYSFERLKLEKSGENYYRADKITPSTLHEIRNCAQSLGLILRGFVPSETYEKYGGLDADMTARLRHDSIEDYAKTYFSIFANMEKHIHSLAEKGDLDKGGLYYRTQIAIQSLKTVDLMTRKETAIDPKTGKIKRDENGKVIKQERYGGDTGAYFKNMMDSVMAVLCKYADRTENVSTRHGVERFDAQSNRVYARETREIYGLEAYDDMVADKWPDFEPAIRCADSMLGVNLLILEGVNKFKSNPYLSPENAGVFRIDRYLPEALIPYQDLPAIFHPISVHLHMLEREVNNDLRMRHVIDHLILPPLQKAVRDYNLKPIPGITAFNQEKKPLSAPVLAAQ